MARSKRRTTQKRKWSAEVAKRSDALDLESDQLLERAKPELRKAFGRS